MGYTTIIDILGAAIIGGILLINLLNANGTLVENDSVYNHDKNLQQDLVITATVVERDFTLVGYVNNSELIGSNANIIDGSLNSIKFRTDIDNNGTIDTITYYLSDLSAMAHTPNPRDMILYRKLNSDIPYVLANNVTRFRLIYFDSQMLPVAPPIGLTTVVNYIQIEFERVFKLFGLYVYSFKTVDKHGFSFRPNCHKKTLEMSKYASFQFFSIESEVKHEITHILRYENGIYNNIPRSDYYLATEEGLATYLQDLVTKDNYSLYQHSAEYMASKVGMNSSLREVYNYFISLGFEPELAWHRSSRHKFGFVDTSKPGDILKPAMYFAQSQNIAKLNQEEILKLFVGKISLKDSEKFDKYYGRFDYNDLKNYFFDNE